MYEYLNQLNEAQKKATLHKDGPAMVIAGAGSGKTRVLTYRIAHLINTGVDSFNILSLTFTNKAAREMKERITQIVGSEAHNIWMGTFHSVFAKILRIEASLIGFPSNFTIYDTDDTKKLIKRIVKELSLDDKVYTPGAVLNRISSAKSNLMSWEDYNQQHELLEEDRATKKPMINKIFEIYSKRCISASAMDFDDLLYYTNLLFTTSSEALLKYQNKFKYILVDEYQDTNYAQYTILKKLAARFENICVVGDDAQSIYAFRGANIQNILSFQNDYRDCKVYKLEQNYRSTQHIVEATNSVIAKNMAQIKKNVWTSNEEGSKIKISRNSSDQNEGIMVARSIFENKMNHQLPNSDFAILYRTNAQSRSIEEALRRANIPYKIYGGLSFYQRKEIKDLIAYFRTAVNYNDEQALLRILNYPNRKIGKTTEEKILAYARQFGVSAWRVMENIRHPKVAADFHAGAKNAITNFVNLIKSFAHIISTQNAYDAAAYIYTHSTMKMSLESDSTPEGVNRVENINELFSAIQDFVQKAKEEESENQNLSLTAFIENIALLTDADNESSEDKDKVSLMTIHAAKGLEFPYVYLVGLEENLFPSQLSVNSRTELEEERRLFYVAITRAEKNLTISYATSRFRFGQITPCEPSRFILDLDKKHLDTSELFIGHTPQPASSQNTTTSWKPKTNSQPSRPAPSFNPKKLVSMNRAASSTSSSTTIEGDYISPSEILAGMAVLHDRFGKGKVMQIEGQDANKKATVMFEGIGQKQLLLKFAKLKPLN